VTEARLTNIRPFVAEMPQPIPGESLLGYLNRALSKTICHNLYSALRLTGGKAHAKQRPRPYNLTIEDADCLAKLFKVDPEEFRSRLYPWGMFEHAEESTIEFFGTKVRSQYFEATIRRVSPRALLISGHHRALWDLKPFSFDPDTRERLLDRCPVCESRLGWVKTHEPFKCDQCAGEHGLSTDLRDYPQPIIDMHDEQAVNFVLGLVHPNAEKRDAAMRLVPDELGSATNSDLFDAVISIASVLLPANAQRTERVGRPMTFDNFAQMTPDRLALAARALIGGESGFGIVADSMRASMSQRPASHGLSKELGSLAALAGDRRIAPAVCSYVRTAIERDLARTQHIGLVRRRTTLIGRHEADEWLNIGELATEFDISYEVLTRLAKSGQVAARRGDGSGTPVQMKRTDVMPIVARYKDAASEKVTRGMLRLPSEVINELAERKVIERIDDVSPFVLGDGSHFTRSSIKAVLIAVDKRARPRKDNSGKLKLIHAVRSFGPHVPWANIISLILAGDIIVVRSDSKSPDWRHNVTVDNLDEFCRVLESAESTPKLARAKWVSREQVARMLGISNLLLVTAMTEAGLLNPRRLDAALIYRRTEVEAAVKKYIFGPEMLKRTVFSVHHELNRWLSSRGVEPAFRLYQKSPIYFRKEFEQALSFQPPLLQKLNRSGRFYSIEEKRRVIDAVTSGSPIGYVSRHMGCKLSLVTEWVEEYRTSGRIKGSGKLDGYEDTLHSIIKQNPKLVRREIQCRLEQEGVEVHMGSIFNFMKKLGYFRDSDGNYRRQEQTVGTRLSERQTLRGRRKRQNAA
jgi:transposase